MNSIEAWLASSSVSWVTPNMYMATMRLDQSSSCGAISAGRPIISAMTMAGIGAAKALQQLDLAVGLEAVDQLIGQPLDAWPQLLDIARYEGAVDQRAQPRVRPAARASSSEYFSVWSKAAVCGLGGGHAELLARHQVEDLPAEALVAEQGADILEAG